MYQVLMLGHSFLQVMRNTNQVLINIIMNKLLILDFDGTLTNAEEEGKSYRTGYLEDVALLADIEVSTALQRSSTHGMGKIDLRNSDSLHQRHIARHEQVRNTRLQLRDSCKALGRDERFRTWSSIQSTLTCV